MALSLSLLAQLSLWPIPQLVTPSPCFTLITTSVPTVVSASSTAHESTVVEAERSESMHPPITQTGSLLNRKQPNVMTTVAGASTYADHNSDHRSCGVVYNTHVAGGNSGGCNEAQIEGSLSGSLAALGQQAAVAVAMRRLFKDLLQPSGATSLLSPSSPSFGSGSYAAAFLPGLVNGTSGLTGSDLRLVESPLPLHEHPALPRRTLLHPGQATLSSISIPTCSGKRNSAFVSSSTSPVTVFPEAPDAITAQLVSMP
ncbi:unnamed protein product, partial [Protopolystoma xenopodis]